MSLKKYIIVIEQRVNGNCHHQPLRCTLTGLTGSNLVNFFLQKKNGL